MRFHPFVLVAAMAVAQTPDAKDYQGDVCPSGTQLEVTPSTELWFEGSLGQKQVRMYLDRGGEAVVGVFYDTDDWLPVVLGGKWMRGDTVELNAQLKDAPFGQLRGRVTAGGFAGVWTPQGNILLKSGPVRLETISQPQCDQMSGTLRQFNDPRWPVTFSYPASWRLDAKGDTLTLTCPDPAAMAYSDFTVQVTHGSFAREGNGAAGFARCGGTWRYGRSCECDNLDACREAEIERGDGITILSGDQKEWRVYCQNGGYVGQGEGAERLILIGNPWIDFYGQGSPSGLIDEIVKTIRRRR